MHGNTKKKWMTFFLRNSFISSIGLPNGISTPNRHLLILDEHGSHITL
jgi:hypothetical protein